MEKSELLIVTVLAVLKANMISVPLDIASPASRLEHILKLCSCHAILTVTQSEQSIYELARIVRIDILVASPELQRLSGDNIDNASFTTEHQICHILFTSGSTGLSKGVKTLHSAVAHNTLAFAGVFKLDHNTRALQFAAPTFAIFVLDTFQTLFSGGCLILATRATIMADITTFIRNSEITFCWLTPTVSRLIDPTQVPSLKILLSSGENLPVEVAERWKQQTSCSLWNTLGSTETLAYTVHNLSESSTSSSHVGQAIPGMKVILLEQGSCDEVEEGRQGEICVAGPQLLQGYLGSSDPQSRNIYIGGTRFFRTGDLGIVEKVACGRTSIRYIGRDDSQVKINGVRIDLGAVETSITGCPLVSQGVALVPRAGNITGQLTAIIALNPSCNGLALSTRPSHQSSHSITALESSFMLISQLGQVKDYVHKALPVYAVPRHWWIVATLPMTTNGKIDRFNLRLWLERMDRSEYLTHIGSWTKTEDIFALEALETKLKSLWVEVLELPELVLRHDASFFEYGADSLTVTRLVSKAREVELSITYEQVFIHKTIRNLANSMISHSLGVPKTSSQVFSSTINRGKSRLQNDTQLQSLPPFSLLGTDDVSAILSSQNDIEDIVPASELQLDYILSSRKLGHPVFVWFFIKLDKTSSITRLLAASKVVTQKHSILRTEFDIISGKCYQVIKKHNIDFKIRGCTSDYDQICSVIDREMAIPSPFGKRLARFRLFVSDTGTQNLGIGLCHSLFDGFSMPLIYRDLEAAYSGTLENLVAPPYSLYIRHSIQTSQHSDTSTFWAELLRGSRITRIFKPQLESLSGGMMQLTRSFQYTWKRHNGTSLAIVLKAAFALTLAKMSRSNDITFGSIASGRSISLDGALEIVGPLLNFIPARLRIDNNMTFSELLQNILDQQVATIPYESTPLTQISRHAGWDSTLFGYTIAVQNVPTQGDFAQWRLAGIASYDFDEHFQECGLVIFPRNDGSLSIQLDFKKGLEVPRVERVLDLFVDILKTINENPEHQASTILSGPLLSEFSQKNDAIPNDMIPKAHRCDHVPFGGIEILTLLKTLWADVLPEVKDPDPNESFFNLGGNNIMAAQLTVLCEKAGFDLKLSDVIECPTLNMQCLRLLGCDVGVKREPAKLTFWSTE